MGWREKNRPEGYEKWGWRGRKSRHGRWLRSLSMMPEKRAYESEFCRLARSPGRLPHPWDDLFIRYQRTWKRHRMTQYKPSILGVR